jgi:2-polyprenyl-6-hydroxyphenyl methylase/3-demethylubiquinone-9 3-methyltransferase
MGVLYQYNYERIEFLRDVLKEKAGSQIDLLRPINGWKVIDVGCGAGFLAESLTRLGANVVGLDPNQTSFM